MDCLRLVRRRRFPRGPGGSPSSAGSVRQFSAHLPARRPDATLSISFLRHHLTYLTSPHYFRARNSRLASSSVSSILHFGNLYPLYSSLLSLREIKKDKRNRKEGQERFQSQWPADRPSSSSWPASPMRLDWRDYREDFQFMQSAPPMYPVPGRSLST